MKHRKKNRIVEVKVDSFSAKGHGIGQCPNPNGGTWNVEVPFSVPGDVVQAKMLSKRRGIYQSFLEGIIQPSPYRIKPKCEHFGVCGGCRWQQIPYEQQLAIKEENIRKCFKALIHDQVKIFPILPCNPPWNYRNKMEFSFSSNAAKERFLGLIIDGSRGKVFNLRSCHLVDHWFVKALTTVKKWWDDSGLDAYHLPTNEGSLRTLILREGQRTGDRMAMVTVSGNPDYALNKQHTASLVEKLREEVEPSDGKLSIFLRIQQIAKGMTTQFYEILLYGPEYIREVLEFPSDSKERVKLEFHISPMAFFQPNTRQSEQLYARAIQMANLSANSIVYDLYCGTGTLGICMARNVQQVVGIELLPEAVLDARDNAARNGLQNVTIFQGDVGKVLAQISAEKKLPPPDVVMVDPPRAGLDEYAIQHLILLNPDKIVYISCNPMTQAANVEKLVISGYRLVEIQPIDQFPHTVHIENIVLLSKTLP